VTARRFRRLEPASLLVLGGAVSVQSGAALATTLFERVGPLGAVSLRLLTAAVVLGVAFRPRPTAAERSGLWVVGLFGLVLGGMNLSFYEALSRLPLGAAVTFEFVGPLAVALAGSRRALDVLWAGSALAGVGLLSAGALGGVHLLGAAFGLLAGGLWAAYILLSRETGRRFAGGRGLALAMACAAVAVVPAGVTVVGRRLWQPGILARGAVVGIASSVVPYSLELAALRRLRPGTFGVLLSLDPAVATLVGAVGLGQTPGWRTLLAVGLVVAASIGAATAAPHPESPEAFAEAP
jgi:inner membrane transporter RhtA